MIVTADDCVQELYDYITAYLVENGYSNDIAVFQYEDKPKSHKGCYIAINALPFVYGFALNDRNIININVHAPSRADGTYYRTISEPWQKMIMELIPTESGDEVQPTLDLKHASYCIGSISQPRKDLDNTHYVNYKIKVITSNI